MVFARYASGPMTVESGIQKEGSTVSSGVLGATPASLRVFVDVNGDVRLTGSKTAPLELD